MIGWLLCSRLTVRNLNRATDESLTGRWIITGTECFLRENTTVDTSRYIPGPVLPGILDDLVSPLPRACRLISPSGDVKICTKDPPKKARAALTCSRYALSILSTTVLVIRKCMVGICSMINYFSHPVRPVPDGACFKFTAKPGLEGPGPFT